MKDSSDTFDEEVEMCSSGDARTDGLSDEDTALLKDRSQSRPADEEG